MIYDCLYAINEAYKLHKTPYFMRNNLHFRINYLLLHFFNENFICPKNGHFYHKTNLAQPQKDASSQLHIYTVTILFVLCKVLKVLLWLICPMLISLI